MIHLRLELNTLRTVNVLKCERLNNEIAIFGQDL